MSDTLRLFFALPLSPPLAGRIARWRHSWHCGGTQVHPHDLHLTLAFLGSQPLSRLDDLLSAGAQVAGIRPFDLCLDHLALWNDGLLHLAPSHPPPELLGLQQKLCECLAQYGFVLEQRPYRPHLTLARRASLPANPPTTGFGWRADKFALFHSEPATIGPRYRQIDAWKLA